MLSEVDETSISEDLSSIMLVSGVSTGFGSFAKLSEPAKSQYRKY